MVSQEAAESSGCLADTGDGSRAYAGAAASSSLPGQWQASGQRRPTGEWRANIRTLPWYGGGKGFALHGARVANGGAGAVHVSHAGQQHGNLQGERAQQQIAAEDAATATQTPLLNEKGPRPAGGCNNLGVFSLELGMQCVEGRGT